MTKVKQSNYNLKEEKKLSIALMSPFVILILQSFVLYYFNITDTGMGVLVNIISKLIVCLFFLISFSIVVKKNITLLLFIYVLSVFIFALNYLFFHQNTEYLNEVFFQYFFICLLCFIYSYSLSDMKIFNEVVEKTSYLLYLIGLCMGILIFSGKMSVGTYNISIGYYLLLPTIIYIKKFLESLKVKYLLLSLFPIIIILAIGSRGPLMCIGLYIFLYHLINLKKVTFKKLMFYMSCTIIIVPCLIYFDDILISISSVLNEFGINSRSLMLITSGEVANTTGRDSISTEVLNQVKDHPFTGIGVTGDRFYTGTYSHNILLEIISSFGIIIGSLLIIFLTFIVICVLASKNKVRSNQFLIWFTVGIIPLFVSSSYLIYYQFWIFLGLSIKFLKETNRKKKEKSKYKQFYPR
ncbi:O-antigen ligase-like membrane protein [Peribacillus frigoritolerans]|uniref:O-antigen ligase family protein n=1 Tax=Peribacillus frigoritolerans TaxID=450367 RepID=UPI00119B055C|nr:O-antigen ligase family protein [Peribacillus frigoritolerans]TWE04180.1 O-antigen ligase-like membrane protein [Peribacillus frigoritolerans]